MRATRLATSMIVLLLAIAGCEAKNTSSDGGQDAGPQDGGDLPDSARPDSASPDGEIPEVYARDAASCETLTTGIDDSIELESDYFQVCGAEPGVADRAFVYTAPEAGFYEVQITRSLLCYGSGAALEVRRGACPQARAAQDSLCAEARIDQDGCPPQSATLQLERGETITAIVEGDGWFIQDEPPIPRLQLLGLHVAQLECPLATSPASDGWRDVSQLSGALPLSETFYSSPRDPIFRDTACSFESSSRRQAALEWTAPNDATYRFDVSTYDGVSLTLLNSDCGGDELDCERSEDGPATLTRAMTADETIVLLVELEGFSDDDADYEISIEAIEVSN